jgi:DNA polymerase I-like protein with 3'-5' exonuclease and polymerase domains
VVLKIRRQVRVPKIRYCTTQRKAERALRPLQLLFDSGKKFRVGIDIETFTVGESALDVHQSRIRTLQLNWGGKLVVLDFLYLDIRRLPIIRDILKSERVLKIGHNLAFEWKFFWVCWKTRMKNVWDTMLSEQVLVNGSKTFGFGLNDLVLDYFGVELEKETRLSNWASPKLAKKQIRYAARDVKYLPGLQAKQQERADDRDYGIIQLENSVLPMFAEMEANGIKIDETQIERVKKEYAAKLRKVLHELQRLLPWVELPKSKQTKKNQLQYPDFYKPVGAGFGAEEFVKDAKNDFKQALEILGIPLPKRYDRKKKKFVPSLTIDNVDTVSIRDSLRELRAQFKACENDKEKKALAKKIIRLRKMKEYPLGAKMKEYFETVSIYNKYLTKMHTWTNPITGRVHPDIRQMKVTGRCSMADPPLQQMPREPWFRSLFIAEKGKVLLKIDYSQLELRLTAEISRDQELISEYCKGLLADIHTKTAVQVFAGGSQEEWDSHDAAWQKERRYRAKAVNFGTIYGQGAQGLQQYLLGYGIHFTLEECADAIASWFSLYIQVRKGYHSAIKNSLRDGLYITKNRLTGEYEVRSKFSKDGAFVLYTLGGRKRIWTHEHLIKLKQVGISYNRKTDDPYIYAICTEEYNHPIQGTAADGMKMAMVKVGALFERLRKKGIDVKMVLQVHDELVIEVDKKHVKYVAKLVRKIMEEEMQRLVKRVPIYCDVQYGPNWAAEKPIEREAA